MIETIYDEEKLKRVVSCRADITSEYMSVNSESAISAIMYQTKKDLATKIAHFVLAEPKFFQLTHSKNFVSIQADVVILTKEEYRADLKEAYEKGMQRIPTYSAYNAYNTVNY